MSNPTPRRLRPVGMVLPLSFIAVSVLLGSPAAVAARFYLSTERVFAPGQQPQVRLEANDVDALDIRLYRIDDPRSWFDQQSDLHRPKAENPKQRLETISLLKKGFRSQLQSFLTDARRRFSGEGRQVLKRALPDLHDKATGGPAQVSDQRVLPPLQDLPLLESWRYVLPDRYGWIYDIIAVPVTEPGAYLVEAAAAGQVAHTVLLVTDVALVTKQSSEQLLVWAVDPASGEPRPGTEVSVLESGNVRATKTTGQDGIARFTLGLMTSPVIYAQQGKSFTLLDPRFFSANLPEPRVYIFTERPVYRPEQTVFLKGFAREVADEAYVAPKAVGDVELEVIDPKGEVYKSWTTRQSERGSFDSSFELPQEPTMGTWQVVATLGGKRYAGQFKVMAYIKPEVRLSVRLDDGFIRGGDSVAGEVEGAYFFGAPYPDAEVKITVTRTRFYIPWYVDADYSWYYSEAEYRNTRREVIQESTCKLDDAGRCTFEFPTKADSEDYTYVVEAAAIDPTGKTVTGSTTATVTRGAFRLVFEQPQLIVKPGQEQTVVVRAEDYARRPVQTDVRVVISAKRLANDGVTETVEVMNQVLRTDAAGAATFALSPQRGGYYEVKASAKDDKEVLITQDTFLFASEGAGELPFAPSDLEIVTDKKSYFVGDRATALILSPAPSSHVLVSVEGGDLYRADVQQANRHALLVQVDITSKQAPNFFISATTMAGGQLFTRQRSVVVPPREQLLTVEVSPDRPEVKPGEQVQFRVHVTDHKGAPVSGAEVAISIVDEAIFAISPEIAVPLEGFFYHRKRNDVRTSDSVTYRFYGTSRELNGRLAALDGDPTNAFGSMKPQLDDVRKVFKDTAGWFPSQSTDEGGETTVTVTLPDNLTSWRATARVVSATTQVGLAKGTVRAKKPLIVRVALPARLLEGDEGEGALLVQNLSGKTQKVALTLSTSPVDSNQAATSPTLQIAEALPPFVEVKNGENRRIPFRFSAKGAGALRIKAMAKSDTHSDSVESTVELGEWAQQRRLRVSGRTSQDSPRRVHPLRIPKDVGLSDVQLEVELSNSTLSAIRASLPYLVEFPWGCTEQTLSRYIPALTVQDAVKKLSLQETSFESELSKAVAFGEHRLWQLQHPDGGWGWWEQDASDVFMTSWVIEGMAQAKRLGQQVDEARLARGLEALERMLSAKQLDATTRAYAVYALARHGRHQRAMLDNLLENAAKQDSASPSQLALIVESALLAGRTEDAARVAAQLAGLARRDESGVYAWWAGPRTAARGETFEDAQPIVERAEEHPVEASARVLLALAGVGGFEALRASGEYWLMLQYDDGHFGTTRQTALVIRALLENMETKPSGEGEVKVMLNGQEIVAHRFTSQNAADTTLRIVPETPITTHALEVVVEQTSGAPMFYTISARTPIRSESIPAASHGGLAISRTYRGLGGAPGAFTVGEEKSEFTMGETVLVTLTVDAMRNVEHVMLRDPRPATLSAVHQTSGMRIEGIDLRTQGTHREHRDQETAYFFRLLPKGRTTVHYLARAGLGGTYQVLPAVVESMYLPATYEAQTSSDRVVVTRR